MEFMTKSIEVIVGTNEEFILGFKIVTKEDGTVNFERSFINHSHIGRIKQVAVSGKFLVSGSSDEYIRIFNLKNREEVGYLLPHNGTVSCLHFHESGFLFSGAEDGNIIIFRKGKWQLEKKLKGHTDGITGFAVHPSGKIGLSISKDKRMITWDLIKGKRAHVAGLKKAGEFILWSPCGKYYLIASENILNIYSIETGNIVQSIDFKENIYSFCYLSENLLAVGGEAKSICVFDLQLQKEILRWNAHENRTKVILAMNSENEHWKQIVTASSDGFIKIWKLELNNAEEAPTLIGEVNTKCRIICMALHSSNLVVEDTDENEVPRKGRKRKLNPVEEDSVKKSSKRLSSNGNQVNNKTRKKKKNSEAMGSNNVESSEQHLFNADEASSRTEQIQSKPMKKGFGQLKKKSKVFKSNLEQIKLKSSVNNGSISLGINKSQSNEKPKRFNKSGSKFNSQTKKSEKVSVNLNHIPKGEKNATQSVDSKGFNSKSKVNLDFNSSRPKYTKTKPASQFKNKKSNQITLKTNKIDKSSSASSLNKGLRRPKVNKKFVKLK